MGRDGMVWVGGYKVALYWYASAVFQHSISPNSIRPAESHNEVILLSNKAKVMMHQLNCCAATNFSSDLSDLVKKIPHHPSMFLFKI